MNSETYALSMPAHWRDFVALTKPRVMTLVVFTALCGLLAAPGTLHPVLAFTAILCIALGAGGAAAFNQWHEAEIDAKMKRTSGRPLPDGRMDRSAALQFAWCLSASSVLVMGISAGWLAAGLLAFSIFFYAVVYTMWLKPNTPQNIVIGGAAGAFPPMIGWVAVTGDVTVMPVLLFMLIFIWTPPHFWALALFVKTDYASAGIPMMPVVRGEKSTRRQIFAYSVLLAATAIAPWVLGYTSMVYGVGSALLSAVFVLLALRVVLPKADDNLAPERTLFKFSIIYLFAVFTLVAADGMLGLV